MANPNLTNVGYIETKLLTYVLDEISQNIVRNPANSGYVIKITDITASNLDKTDGVIAQTITLGIVRSGVTRYLAFTIEVIQNNTITLVSDITSVFLEEGDTLFALAGKVDTVAISVNFQILSEAAFTYSNLVSRLVSSSYDVLFTGSSFTIRLKAGGHPTNASYAYTITGVSSAQINNAPLSGFIGPNASITFNTTSSTAATFVFNISSLSISVSVSLTTYNFAFTSFTFTSANLTGQNGPTLAQCLQAYNTVNNPWLNNTAFFNVTSQGIQEFTVPQTASYRISARGGDGGVFPGTTTTVNKAFPGAGALVSGTFFISKDTKLYIVVGQRPSSDAGQSNINGSAGGGGTFVYGGTTPTSSIGDDAFLYMAAGGGGGTGHGANVPTTTGGNGKGGSSTTNSRESLPGESFGINPRLGNGSTGNQGIGLGGNGGGNNSLGGSGGGTGWKGVGQSYQGPGGIAYQGFGGQRFQGGGNTVDGPNLYGGWGGGGGSDGNGNGGGGGGGYTGGGAGNGYGGTGYSSWGGGGGGGSFVNGAAVEPARNQGSDGINVIDVQNGFVQILKI